MTLEVNLFVHETIAYQSMRFTWLVMIDYLRFLSQLILDDLFEIVGIVILICLFMYLIHYFKSIIYI